MMLHWNGYAEDNKAVLTGISHLAFKFWNPSNKRVNTKYIFIYIRTLKQVKHLWANIFVCLSHMADVELLNLKLGN